MKYFIHTDGGAKGNPGPGAIGVVIKDEKGKIIHQFGKEIRVVTNNEAEYRAVIEGLKALKFQISSTKSKTSSNFPASAEALAGRQISNENIFNFFLDSKLVVNQLNGLFKVKNARIRELLFKIRELEKELGGKIHYNLIPREKNWEADALVNKFQAPSTKF